MPCKLGGATQRLAGLVAAIDQPLMRAAAAGSKERQWRFVPERRVHEVDAAKFTSPLGARHSFTGELQQLACIGHIIASDGHHAASPGSISTASPSMILALFELRSSS